MTHAPKIATQKKQPISILRDEKYLTYTALTLLNPDIVHKTMQQSVVLWLSSSSCKKAISMR